MLGSVQWLVPKFRAFGTKQGLTRYLSASTNDIKTPLPSNTVAHIIDTDPLASHAFDYINFCKTLSSACLPNDTHFTGRT